MGSDIIHARELAMRAVRQEYAIDYAGEGAAATRELGEALIAARVERFVRALKAVKADTRTLELQNEFFDRVEKR